MSILSKILDFGTGAKNYIPCKHCVSKKTIRMFDVIIGRSKTVRGWADYCPCCKKVYFGGFYGSVPPFASSVAPNAKSMVSVAAAHDIPCFVKHVKVSHGDKQ